MTTDNDSTALIKTAVTAAAAKARYNAGMDGAMHDGGEGRMKENLEYWLDGVTFARTGVTDVYAHLIRRGEREADPDYKKYLELKLRFG